jgi:hypothetical protein
MPRHVVCLAYYACGALSVRQGCLLRELEACWLGAYKHPAGWRSWWHVLAGAVLFMSQLGALCRQGATQM